MDYLESFIIVVADNKKFVYQMLYGVDKQAWRKNLSTLDKERYTIKFFGSELRKKNAENYIKFLRSKRYKEIKFPFVF